MDITKDEPVTATEVLELLEGIAEATHGATVFHRKRIVPLALADRKQQAEWVMAHVRAWAADDE